MVKTSTQALEHWYVSQTVDRGFVTRFTRGFLGTLFEYVLFYWLYVGFVKSVSLAISRMHYKDVKLALGEIFLSTDTKDEWYLTFRK
jgi:hypothetical protein